MKTLKLELAIDPATYVMTKGIRYETADIGRARLTLAATKRLEMAWGLVLFHYLILTKSVKSPWQRVTERK